MTSLRLWALAALGLALLACDPGGDGPDPAPEDGAEISNPFMAPF